MLRKKFVYIVVVFVCSIIVLVDKYKEDNKNITRKEVVASNRNTNLNPFPEQQSAKIKENAEDVANEENENIKGLEIPLAPKNTQSLLLKRKAYTVSFNKMTNQPNWVAWCLTDDELSGKVSRSKDFYEDPDLPLMHRVVSEDYKGCGYDRGHMAPAADMKFSARAMRECFYMSNICPQNHELNAGGWEKVERACRRWAEKYKKVYIVCGPIFSGKSKSIGREHIIMVPDSFFKCIYTKGKKGHQAIAFIFKNTSTKQNMNEAVVCVDKVEKITGMDFFYMLPDDIECEIEQSCSLKQWQ